MDSQGESEYVAATQQLETAPSTFSQNYGFNHYKWKSCCGALQADIPTREFQCRWVARLILLPNEKVK